ncbi:MAG: hypothetical protein ACKO96_12350, partial [Flammeovirgaceae bacterium]
MHDIIKTNEDFNKLCESHGDSYITGFYLRKYELLVTNDKRRPFQPNLPLKERGRSSREVFW